MKLSPIAISIAIAAASTLPSTVSNADTDNSSVQLEEIVVTARKKEESLFEVPIAVSVLNEQFFERTGINTIEDVVKFVPGFDYSPTNTSRASGSRIRGISTFSFSDGFESSVATVIDGVVMGREAQGFFDLYDIEALEVIKGPQGTLFGKNASAGVVNIRTKRPEFELSGGADATYGSFDQVKLRSSITGPIVDDLLAARLTFTSNENNGKIENTFPGQDDVNSKDTWAARAKFLLTPNDDFEALLTLDMVKEDNRCCVPTYRTAGPFSGTLAAFGVQQLQSALDDAGITADDSNRKVAIFDANINQKSEAKGIGLELNYDLGWATVTSITAARDWEIDEFNEADQLSAVDVNNRNGTVSDSQQFSQEFRLSGALNDSVEYVAGVYYFDQDLDATGSVAIELPISFAFNSLTLSDRTVKTESFAAFSEFTLELSDQTTLILGGRYTNEEVKANYDRKTTAINPNLGGNGFNFGPDLIGAQKEKDTNFSGRAILRHFWSEELMTYVSYSKGYKGTGIDVAVTVNADVIETPGGLPTVDPEIPTLWELGVKARFLDNALKVNAVAFHQSVENLQTITTDNQGQVRNDGIDEVISNGVEADITFTPAAVEGLSIAASITYLDVRYEEYKIRPQLEDQQLNGVPYWATSLTSDYVFSVGNSGYSAFVRGEYIWQADKTATLGKTDSYGVMNVRMGLTSPDDKYSLILSANNVFDKDYNYVVSGSSFSALDGNATTTQYLADPATYTVTLGVKF